MRVRRAATLSVAIILSAGVGAGVAAAAVGASSGPPPAPPWVRPDGTVDVSKLPTRIEVLGGDGRVLRDEAGRPVVVDMHDEHRQALARLGDESGLTSGKSRVFRNEQGVLVEEEEVTSDVPGQQ